MKKSLSASATLWLHAGCLLILFLAGCSSGAPKPKSVEEEAELRESKAQEHRVFYEGWLHPS